jgi:phosphodiesterase/alkaline phosphatase D-like protein
MTRISRLRPTIAATATTIMCLFLAQARPACAREDSEPRQTNVSPAVESVSDTLAFINWTTENPGGAILHYAVVHYGKDPNHLDLKAESPTRINPSHSEMVFRVRMGDLEPGTTYYYRVSSRQATGILDPAPSTVNKFTTRPANWMSANK